MSRSRLLPFLFLTTIPAALLTITPQASAAAPAPKSCIDYRYSGVGTAITGIGNTDPEMTARIKKLAEEINKEADKKNTGRVHLRKPKGRSELSWEYQINVAWKPYITSDIEERGMHYNVNDGDYIIGHGETAPLSHKFTSTLTELETGDHVTYSNEFTFTADIADEDTKIKITTVGILDIKC